MKINNININRDYMKINNININKNILKNIFIILGEV